MTRIGDRRTSDVVKVVWAIRTIRMNILSTVSRTDARERKAPVSDSKKGKRNPSELVVHLLSAEEARTHYIVFSECRDALRSRISMVRVTSSKFSLFAVTRIIPHLCPQCPLQKSGSVRTPAHRNTDEHSRNTTHDSHRRVLRARKSPHRGRSPQR
jgi:hypothetical protein